MKSNTIILQLYVIFNVFLQLKTFLSKPIEPEIARGSTVRARNIGKDIFAGLKNIVGGEIEEYTQLQADSREQAMQRMVKDAERLNADAIVNVRLASSMVMNGAAEILAYGTAVRLSK